MSAENIRTSLLTRFRRRGGPTRQTAAFSAFPQEQQRQILALAHLTAQESPILLSCRDEHAWLLLTTRRIVWKNGLAVDALRGAEIETILSPANPTADPARFPVAPTGAPMSIVLVTGRGHRLELPVEPDKTAYAAMHDLLSFIATAARQPATSSNPIRVK